MAPILTREELHTLVWRKPLKTLVEPLGLCESTIKKRCKDKSIPLPTAAYWKKRDSRQAVSVPPLPPRAAGMDELVSFAREPRSPVSRQISEEELLGPIPDPPVFDEPLEDIRTRYRARIGDLKVERHLAQAHHKIRAFLAEDDRRRAAELRRGYQLSSDAPQFDTPFEQRRLRILNVVLMEITRAGGIVRVWDQAARIIRVRIHDIELQVVLDHAERIAKRHHHYGYGKTTPIDAEMHLVLEYSYESKNPEGHWADDKRGRLEDNLGVILPEFFVQAEACYRRFRVGEIESRARSKAWRLECIQKEKERAEREQREREEALRKERIELLCGLAAQHDQARMIRDLIANGLATLPPFPRLDEWSAWAMTVADELDPVCNGNLAGQPQPPGK